MITLVNLVKDGDVVKTDYFEESNSNDRGHIEYDIKQKKAIKYSYSREDRESRVKLGFSKSIRAIEKLVEYNKFPNRYRYLWY